METSHQHQKNRENRENDVHNQKQNEGQSAKQPSPTTSQSSSPSHEFSFTISLHSNSSTTTTILDKSRAPPSSSSLAIDLSPADEIFFHGHLLPLHLLSHLPSSPRFSTNSMDSLSLPGRPDFLEDEKVRRDSGSCNTSCRSNITISDSISNNYNKRALTKESSYKPCKHSFSLFGLTKGRKGCQVSETNKEDNENNKQKRKLGIDVIHALKRYFRMVQQPLGIFKGRREKIGLHGNAYSHSANLVRKNKPELMRGRRGEHSAPASMRTSPTNSGLLLAKATTIPPAAASDSTMEELQAAIQAAIAHCKNSSAKEEKLKC